MSKDKYRSIFSRQMETIAYIYRYVLACVARRFEQFERDRSFTRLRPFLASSRRSFNQGAAQKTAREKKKKKRGERKLPLTTFFLFFRALFSALTERLEEAIAFLAC